jgi:hypothetical protein
VTAAETSTELTTAETSKAAAVEAAATAAVETSATSTAYDRQGIRRNCCGAKETGCSERDSNLA